MANRIILIGRSRHEEFIASGAITPGHLIEQTSTALSLGNGTAKVHATEGGYAERIFAVEDALQGKLISDAYANAAVVSAEVAEPGAVVNAWLKAGENVSIGDRLISAGDGMLIEDGSEGSGTTVRQIVAYALAAVNLSASSAVNTRITVRVV